MAQTAEYKRTIGYVRVSDVGPRGGDTFLSPELQRESIERACQSEGLDLVDVVVELGRGGDDNPRPLWPACIDQCARSGETTSAYASQFGLPRRAMFGRDRVSAVAFPHGDRAEVGAAQVMTMLVGASSEVPSQRHRRCMEW